MSTPFSSNSAAVSTAISTAGSGGAMREKNLRLLMMMSVVAMKPTTEERQDALFQVLGNKKTIEELLNRDVE
ncbi:hypothetical protein FB192DRAFT_1448308 [Mucor lusitanicus]|uniref:Uncharacterized protein n=2 Tax=Mucor circinelloides f. lusitanicus TaxID=29924 RepID=A0A168IPY3_MUCCL|nr:hypothetical protein FB192DRAFT_1448308 [Mucor lusitanicus]OAD00205.1 hypothetical protein MUCCIDRAFT_113667 [Mucor lusitanicus CBS 277.49]